MNLRIQTLIKFCILPILATAFTLGCSSYQSTIPSVNDLLAADTGQDGKTCIRQVDINGYGVLNDYAISVDTRGKKHYIVTTMYRCPTLNTGFQAGFDGNRFDFCPIRDRLITSDEACPVKAIYEFESRQQAFATFNQAEEVRKSMQSEMKNSS